MRPFGNHVDFFQRFGSTFCTGMSIIHVAMSPQNYDNPDPNLSANSDAQGSSSRRGSRSGKSPASSGLPVSKDPISRFHANFAHEMANLLDGSLRNVSLVMASLREVQQQRDVSADQTDARPTAVVQAGDEPAALVDAKPMLPSPSPELVLRLETADIAMRQMAQMIQQLLADPQGQATGGSSTKTAASSDSITSPRPNLPGPIYSTADTFTLAQAVEHVMRLLKPIADEQQIDLQCEIDPSAASLPIGPLFPVIVNAVRNSLQAIAAYQAACDAPSDASDDLPFVVQVNASMRQLPQGQYLQITITDNGPGLDPVTLDQQGRFQFGASTRGQGHGLGLPLARDIVKTLGGDIDITGPGRGPRSAQYDPADPAVSTFIKDHGTQLVVMIPSQRLTKVFVSPNQ